MRIRPTTGYHTCSACEHTTTEAYALTIGTLVLSLCAPCLRVLGRLLRREERRAEA